MKEMEAESTLAESTREPFSSIYVRQVQQRRPESPTVTLAWHACQYVSITMYEDVTLVEFMYLVFTRMPGESYRRRIRSLLLYLSTYIEC